MLSRLSLFGILHLEDEMSTRRLSHSRIMSSIKDALRFHGILIHMQFWAGRLFLSLIFLIRKLEKKCYLFITMRIKQDNTYNVSRKVPGI